ncbi:MAG: right-handed parallel beta-helix repeat-containing protein [Phycisphaerales bacterium]
MLHLSRSVSRRHLVALGQQLAVALIAIAAVPAAAKPGGATLNDGDRAVTRAEPVIWHVSPDAMPNGDGSRDRPLPLDEAVRRLSAEFKASGVPVGGVTVLVDGGVHPILEPIRLGPECAGSPESPIVIRAAPGAEPVFDGGRAVAASSFAPVDDADERRRLAGSAAASIRVTTIDDPDLIAALASDVVLTLVYDGRSYLPSVFPNAGYARLDNTPVEGEVSPPAIPIGKQAYGVRAGVDPWLEPGREPGWKGSRTEPRGAWAGVRARGDEMAGTWAQWEAELARNNRRNVLSGFLDADWLLGAQPLVAADAEREAMHLSRVLAYGWAWRNSKPFRVFGLLCELDAPGEWHFDPLTNRLFIFPPTPLTDDTTISLPAADGFVTIDGAQHVSIVGLDVQALASGIAWNIVRGTDNLIASSTVQSSTAMGASLDGQRNRLIGCDFVDLNRHVRLGGGRRGDGVLEAGDNEVSNCHLYQRSFRHQKVNVGISGVGNRFANNLIHNSLGQAVVVSGNDHRIERNELFNIGFDEGDGGAIYAGADLTGYGVVYRHNFFHHLMHVPGKVTRAGIHLDDLQAGSTCEGNIFFKSAEKAIFMNGGAGHRIVGNLFLEGRFGALNRGSGGQKNFDRQRRITAEGDGPRRYSKEDYVGRAERTVGPDGWNRSPWAERYPVFARVMNDDGQFGRLWPIGCHVEGNHAYGNRRDQTIWDRVPAEAAAKSTLLPDTVIRPEIFADYASLDLRIVDDSVALDIPFESIGLQLDAFRDAMPDPRHYRQTIRTFFDGIGSMPGTDRKIDTAVVVESGPMLRRGGA